MLPWTLSRPSPPPDLSKALNIRFSRVAVCHARDALAALPAAEGEDLHDLVHEAVRSVKIGDHEQSLRPVCLGQFSVRGRPGL